jgi:hypothetical protein
MRPAALELSKTLEALDENSRSGRFGADGSWVDLESIPARFALLVVSTIG